MTAPDPLQAFRAHESLLVLMSRRPFLVALMGTLLPGSTKALSSSQVTFAPLSGKFAAMITESRDALRNLRKKMADEKIISVEATQLQFGQAILDHHLFAPDPHSGAKLIGVLIGDVIVSRGGFQWLVVTDQYGTEPVVCHDRKQAFSSPISSVMRRLGRGEMDFDIAALADGLATASLSQLGDARDLSAKLRK